MEIEKFLLQLPASNVSGTLPSARMTCGGVSFDSDLDGSSSFKNNAINAQDRLHNDDKAIREKLIASHTSISSGRTKMADGGGMRSSVRKRADFNSMFGQVVLLVYHLVRWIQVSNTAGISWQNLDEVE